MAANDTQAGQDLLSALEATLKGAEANLPFVFNRALLGTTEEAASLFMLLSADQLLFLSKPAYVRDGNKLTLNGQATLLDLGPVAATLIIEQTEAGHGFSLITEEASRPLPLQGLGWVILTRERVRIDISAGEKNVSGVIDGAAILDGREVSLSIELPLDEDGWRVSSTFAEGKRPGLLSLASLVKGLDDVVGRLPKKLQDDLGALGVAEINFQAQSSPLVSFTLASPAGYIWPLVADALPLGIGDLKIHLDIALAERQIEVRFAGTIKVGEGKDAAAIPIVIGKVEGTGEWELQITGDFLVLPGLPDLARLFKAQDLFNIISPGFSNLGGLQLVYLNGRFDPERKQVSSIGFSILSEKGLTIPQLPGFAVSGLVFDLTIVEPTSTQNKAVLGHFEGAIRIRDFQIAVRVERRNVTDGWLLQLSVEGIELPSLGHLAELLGNASLFEKLPLGFHGSGDLALSNFEMLFDADSGALAYAGMCVTISKGWEIVPGAFSICNAELAMSVGSSPNRDISGRIEATLKAGEYEFTVAATHPEGKAGWAFEGRLSGSDQEIPLGRFLAEITKGLRLINSEKVLPPSLEGLTIKDLGVSFNIGNKEETNFTFTCQCQFPINDKAKVAITLAVSLTRQSNASYKKEFSGHIDLDVAKLAEPLQFDLKFVDEKAGTTASEVFIATYHHGGNEQKLNLGDLVRSVVHDAPQWASALDGIEVDLKDALFAYSKANQQGNFLFGLDIGTNISLSRLPLVGKEFSPDPKIGIDDLQVLIASKPFYVADVNKLNALIPDEVTKLPDISKSAGAQDKSQDDTKTIALKKGLNVGAKLKLGEMTRDLALPATAAGSPDGNQPSETTTTPNPSATTTDNATWLKIQKSLGPVHFERVGAQYKDAKVWFLLDAALTAAGLTISLEGLSINSPLNKFEPCFELRGLGIDYRNDSLEIGGAFLKIAEKEYAGAAVIRAKQLTLSALGMYKELSDGHPPSVFVYAVLDYPLGGPSFFVVTGLAAGFGYNRALKIPTIDKVASFSLVENARKGAGMPKNLGEELRKLGEDITPAAGENFLAIGIKFTSFKIIDSFALLTVSFGSPFELNLLGLSNLVAPANAGKGVSPVAEVQLALKASFLPDKGFLGVQAQLTPNSYLLSKACHLTGGFAFFSWFAGSEHDGDFVLTLGGYHPHFLVPAHYPTVPRLGFNWQVSDALSLKGDAYFALTASALMAGGHLEANWRSGSVHAWFKLGADFLIAWQPYYYKIGAYIALGAEVTFEFFGTQHISIEVGADLSIWGPEFSGEATIHLWIISFTVKFGASASHEPKEIDWPAFKASFLPADKDVCTIAVTGGLIGKDSQDALDLGVINPKQFLLATNSVIPSNVAQVALKNGKQPLKLPSSPGRFGIASMAVAADDLTSTQTITIKRGDVLVGDEFEYRPIFKNVPAGLWGESLTPTLNGTQFVENALSGFEIHPKVRSKDPDESRTSSIERGQLQATRFSGTGNYQWESTKQFSAALFDSEQQRREELQRKLAEGVTGRDALLKALGFTEEDLGKIALETLRADDFLIAPQIQQSGDSADG